MCNLVRPTASSKAPAKAKAPPKAKATSSGPPPKKRNRVEATCSHSAQPQERATHEYGIKSVPPSGRAWYMKCRPNSYLPDFAVDEHKLKSRYPQIWERIHELGLGFVSARFYVGYNLEDKEQLVPIPGRLIDILARALCRFLDAPNVPCSPLCDFIDRPAYTDIRYTLCGVNSYALWTQDKRYNACSSLPKSMSSVFLDKKVVSECEPGTLTRIFFVNLLMQYLRREQFDEETTFDMLIPATSRAIDIAVIRGPDEEDGTTLATAERQIGGTPATSEERTQLTEQFPLTVPAIGWFSRGLWGEEEQFDPAVDATGEDLGDDVDDWDKADRAFFDEGHRLQD
ncbi:hypothetical protein A4A49_51727 [Nicotiana attenuata]|uniref:Uncharacterized protein n=1 Tax=Nicotiana attenuata TaxID=49451 RepID=A0A314KTT6_NICAT|nr:hypothetical protein A4A49_51727 [Nicotiana attenuata]